MGEEVTMVAVDSKTGVVLNESLEWATNQDMATWRFESYDEAVEFAKAKKEENNSIELIITKANGEVEVFDG